MRIGVRSTDRDAPLSSACRPRTALAVHSSWKLLASPSWPSWAQPNPTYNVVLNRKPSLDLELVFGEGQIREATTSQIHPLRRPVQASSKVPRY